MKSLCSFIFLSSLLLVEAATAGPLCQGAFPNPVTDYCWTCTLPIKLFGTIPLLSDDQEDTNTLGTTPICACGSPVPKLGTPVSFWEPSRMVDVTRTPYCFVTLGGIQINLGFGDQFTGTQSTNSTGGVKQTRRSVYHVHWYINPTMVLASIILDNACLDNQGFDIAYMSEIDPTWGDSELENLLEPDAFLFGNIIEQAACAADCVASSIGFGSNTLFWCAGCNGSLYPLNGDVQAHIGGVQASSLLVQRTAARLHRMGTQWAASGSQGLCGYYPQILMDKNNYKYSMSYPAPQGKGDGANNAPNTAMASGMTQGWQGTSATGLPSATESLGLDKCCQPFGRTTILWGAGKEIPYVGEDFGYIIYRKRDCCQSGSF